MGDQVRDRRVIRSRTAGSSLDVACVEQSGAEAATALDRSLGLAPLVPGAQGVVYDTAFRGVHHQRLMRDLGWVSVNRVTANAGSRKRPAKDRKRVEKTVHVETNTIRTSLSMHVRRQGPAPPQAA